VAGFLAVVVPLALLALLLPFPGSAVCLVLLIFAVLLSRRWMFAPGAVPVLTYHSVSAAPDWSPWSDGLSLPPETFERQLKILAKGGYNVIPTGELLKARRAGRHVPERSVVLHFDDGYLDNWVAVYPLLERYGMPATIFASMEFIAPGEELRPTLREVAEGHCDRADLEWDGYANWAELRAMQASGLVDIEPHGIDHGRVPIGPGVVDRLTPGNWRRYAWLQWANMPGDKSSWYDHDEPPAMGYGSDVLENDSALAVPAWLDGMHETEAEYVARVRAALRRSKDELSHGLDKEVRLFCWPHNRCSSLARAIAEEEGYWATTGGSGENRLGENPKIVSRTHAGDAALGWRWNWVDDFAFWAALRLYSGSYYWYIVLAPLYFSRQTVLKLRRKFRRQWAMPPSSRRVAAAGQ